MPLHKSTSRPAHAKIPGAGKKRHEIKRGNKTIIRSALFNRGMGGTLPSTANPYQVNDTDAFVPEMWAEESVRTLVEEMVFAGTVHRDFDPMVARFGDEVHTRSMNELSGKRKQNDFDNIVDQDITATDVPVKLNQRIYTSFLVGDAERSMSFVELVDEYLPTAMRGPSRMLDRIVAGQCYQFRANGAGGLGTLSKTTGTDYMIDMRGTMNTNKVSTDGRWVGWTVNSDTELQKTDLFKSAERVGDGGRALREAEIGRMHGFNNFLGYNAPSVTALNGTADAVNNAAGYAKGHTGVIAMDSGAAVVVGQYATIAGDNQPQRVTAIATNDVTFDTPLLNAVVDNAVVTPVATALVDQSSAISAAQTHGAVTDGYPTNWSKEIVYDGTGAPQVGQLVGFATAGSPNVILAGEYSIVDVDTVNKTILLDRPLETDIADNDVICLGPGGDFNFAYQREAIALVNRPMALPIAGTGVRAARATFEDFSLHVKISYDDVKEAHRINVGGLLGIKVLNVSRGGIIYG